MLLLRRNQHTDLLRRLFVVPADIAPFQKFSKHQLHATLRIVDAHANAAKRVVPPKMEAGTPSFACGKKTKTVSIY